jgi:hypothetical protein
MRGAIGNRHGQSHPSEHGNVYQIITHVGYTLVTKLSELQNLLIVSELVPASLHHKLNPQISSTVVNHLRSPTCEQGHLYPSSLEQTNAMAVVNVENLTFLTISMPN